MVVETLIYKTLENNGKVLTALLTTPYLKEPLNRDTIEVVIFQPIETQMHHKFLTSSTEEMKLNFHFVLLADYARYTNKHPFHEKLGEYIWLLVSYSKELEFGILEIHSMTKTKQLFEK